MNTKLQNILCEFRFVPFVFEMLDALFQLVTRDEICNEVYGPEFLVFTIYCFRILRNLAKDNDTNSGVLYTAREKLIEQLGFPFKAADVLSEIFGGTPGAFRVSPAGCLLPHRPAMCALWLCHLRADPTVRQSLYGQDLGPSPEDARCRFSRLPLRAAGEQRPRHQEQPGRRV